MSNDTDPQETPQAGNDIEQGTYEILKARLEEHAKGLRARAESLNKKRLELFGGTEMSVVGNERIRTDNNCVPRDIETVGDLMMFGYNVFLGLRTEIKVEDVFSLHTFKENDSGGFTFDTISADDPRNFLTEKKFIAEFQELYKYYKDTKLLQLRKVDGKLLAIFKTGNSLEDIKVFRWALTPDGKATYIDNRGERDDVLPPSHDFEWIETTRDHHVLGRHPHVSILDEVFVETVGGDLTVKVEDNTEDGFGIYREDVDEPHQSLADAKISYAKLGTLIVMKVLPYNETVWRYLVFNTRTQEVDRIDAIGQACQSLPEDHGLIFPGGYYLQDGTNKTFEGTVEDMLFKRVIRSPNGEDVLYVFHERLEGRSILLNYNLIRKEVQNPIHCHGMALFHDGKLVIFRSINDEPTRVHPMQMWQTPYVSDEFAAQAPTGGSYLEKVGNAELVRGISDALSVSRVAIDQEPSVQGYEDLIASSVRMSDAFYWLSSDDVGNLAEPLVKVRETADLIVGEFQKVQAIRARAVESLEAAEAEIDALFHRLRSEPRESVDPFVRALAELRTQRGKLISLKELRYMDIERVDALEARLVQKLEELSAETVEFLLQPEALQPYHQEIDEQVHLVESVDKTTEAGPIAERLEEISHGLEMLTEIIGGLDIADPTQRTGILEGIAEVLAALNRGRAIAEARRRELLSTEGRAEFGAQFQLLGQSVSGGLAMADSPEKCDEQLSKLLLQLEELEGRFGEFDEFLDQLSTKREDIYEAFSSKKQNLMDERQRKAGRMLQAAERILDGIRRRSSSLNDADALNAYFVGDAMVAKLRDLAKDLRALGDSVKADELESKLKTAREEAARSMRDRADIYESGTDIIRFGRHRFSVNTQAFDLTMVPQTDRDGETVMAFHLTGTDFHSRVQDEKFQQTREYWNQLLVSETETVYRGEYLAASMLADAEQEKNGLSLDALQQAVIEGAEDAKAGLLQVVRTYIAERYDEGYERGLHDHDAALILEQLVSLYTTAGLLRFAPRPRAMACLFWAFFPEQTARVQWERRSRSLSRLRDAFAHSPAITRLVDELSQAVRTFLDGLHIEITEEQARLTAGYLFEELSKHPPGFTTSAEAEKLRDAFFQYLDLHQSRRDFDEDLQELADDLSERYHLARAWMQAFLDAGHSEMVGDDQLEDLRPSLDEAVVLMITDRRLERITSSALQGKIVEGLLGQHPRIKGRVMSLRLDELLSRLTAYRHHRVPGFRAFQQARHRLLQRQRDELRLDEFKPKVMSAFVRNRLISEVYLPIIGDNLAKQMGTTGEGKRTDQMGLLLLISPPGYGKTTLMEYIANRLGQVFVKVNGPALGHGVLSLDPDEAPNATARQEVQKINFALEMGNNVLLYLDDIQHTHPELLQKFISLCDAQRRIEGVWNGRTRTYDMKGKRFAVCMAGNPYTESGEAFQIPDMLANRADTHNLGDILEGKDDVFALSYIENALTSNPVLAPLTTRDPKDVGLLVKMAQGDPIQADQLSHDYSGVELEEMISVLKKMLRIQEVVLQVNQQYIESAAQDDAFRTEPRFQLQGSYRNMNKLAEKVVAVMNDKELEALIDDHYAGEAQTLTTGAEANLLKLGEMRGTLTEKEAERWGDIKRGFARVQAMGGSDEDPAVRMLGQLGLMSDRLSDIDRAILKSTEKAGDRAQALVAAQSEAAAATAKALAETAQAAQAAAGRSESEAAPSTVGIQLGPELAQALEPYVAHLRKTLEGLGALHSQQTKIAQAAVKAAKATKPSGQTEDPTRQVTDRLDGVLEKLTELVVHGQSAKAVGPIMPAAPGAKSAPAGPDLTPYLDRLDQTLRAVAEAPRGAQIVQTLPAGIVELFGELSEAVDENLLPLVQGLGRHMKFVNLEDRKISAHLDRTLKSLDHLKDLVESLSKIDTTGLVKPAS